VSSERELIPALAETFRRWQSTVRGAGSPDKAPAEIVEMLRARSGAILRGEV